MTKYNVTAFIEGMGEIAVRQKPFVKQENARARAEQVGINGFLIHDQGNNGYDVYFPAHRITCVYVREVEDD